MDCQTGIEDIGQFLTAELGECAAVDLRTIQQGLVGRRTDRIDLSVHVQCEAEVFDSICDSLLTGACGKGRGVTIQRRGAVQRFHMQVLDLAGFPTGAYAKCLVVAEHRRVVVEGGGVVVVTG